MRISLLIIGCICGLFLSCNDEFTNSDPVDFKSNYFPVFVGKSTIYSIDSLFFDNFSQNGNTDTIHVDYKDSIVSFENENYMVNRYQYNEMNKLWVLQKIYTIKASQQTIQVTEDNLTLVKLIFPVVPNKKWNAFSFYNTIKQQEYEYIEVDIPMSINQFMFDSVLRVLQVDTINLIRETTAYEYYAKNVGLIKRETTNIERDSIGAAPNGTKIITTIKQF